MYLHCKFLLQRHSYVAHFSYKGIVTSRYLHCTFLLQWPFLYRPGSLRQLLFWDALIARGLPVPTSIKHYHGQKRFVVSYKQNISPQKLKCHGFI